VKEDEMDRLYSTNGTYVGYSWESQNERDHWEEQDVCGICMEYVRGVLKYILRKNGWGNIDSIDLAQVRDQWRASVNSVMNLQVP
jgi:hypothetical protein